MLNRVTLFEMPLRGLSRSLLCDITVETIVLTRLLIRGAADDRVDPSGVAFIKPPLLDLRSMVRLW